MTHSITLRKFSPAEMLRLAAEDGARIQNRFAAEPVLARTGKGHYESAGVKGLLDDIEYVKQTFKPDETK